MTDRTFNIAGWSTLNGQVHFRFANHPEGKINIRTNMLKHTEHEDINLFELPKAMTQVQAMAWLKQNKRVPAKCTFPTRASDKSAKPEIQLQAEELASKQRSKAATAKGKAPAKPRSRGKAKQSEAVAA